MKKKLLALLLAVAMVSVLVPVSALAEEEGAVAESGATKYATVDDLVSAIEDATDDLNITLLQDITLGNTTGNIHDFGITIDGNANVTINMNGHKISRDNRPILVQNATLTLNGTGIVEETKADGHAPIVAKGSTLDTDENYTVVNVGSGITLKGKMGLFIRFSSDAETVAKGVVINFDGKIIASELQSTGVDSDGIAINGRVQDATNCPKINIGQTASIYTAKGCAIYAAGYVEWTIEGGSFTGSQCIEMKAGTMEINGGTFEATGNEKHEAFSNGPSTGGYALSLVKNSDYGGIGNVTINDGSFKDKVAIFEDDSDGVVPTLVVTGGKFTNDLTGYIVAGKYAKPITDATYAYEVAASANPDVKLAPVAAAVEAAIPEGASENVKAAINEAAGALGDDDAVDVAGLDDVLATTNITPATTTVSQEQLDALKKLQGNDDITADNAVVYVQPFMDIKVADAVADGNTITSLTLDIKPMYQTVIAPNGVSAAAINTTESTGNAVKVGDAKPLTVPQNTPVVISFKLPTGFVVDENLKVKHVKANGDVYYYDVAVTGTGNDQIATFTVTNGFSEFTLKSDTREAVVDFRFNTPLTETGNTTLEPTDVGISLPTDYKAGSSFNGWEFGTEEEEVGFTRITGADGVYTVLPDAVLTALSDFEGDIIARPVFTANYVYDIFADSLINPVEVTEDPLDVQEATDETGELPEDETDALPDEGDIVDEPADEPVPATGDLAASALPALLPLIALAFAAKKKR